MPPPASQPERRLAASIGTQERGSCTGPGINEYLLDHVLVCSGLEKPSQAFSRLSLSDSQKPAVTTYHSEFGKQGWVLDTTSANLDYDNKNNHPTYHQPLVKLQLGRYASQCKEKDIQVLQPSVSGGAVFGPRVQTPDKLPHVHGLFIVHAQLVGHPAEHCPLSDTLTCGRFSRSGFEFWRRQGTAGRMKDLRTSLGVGAKLGAKKNLLVWTYKQKVGDETPSIPRSGPLRFSSIAGLLSS
ncbi:hypothetical protein BDN67DRAFT_983774 [Paxillus ammoniavirescens]|nr:hypothetical protein BDN67DRAFT_983774 [Paxillus ammoniavirescens]